MAALAGLQVLVTRPAERAAGLVRAICELGGTPLACPTLIIEPAPMPPSVSGAVDIVLFVSPAAVAYGAQHVLADCASAPEFGGVGPATIRALVERGWAPTIEPVDGNDSEALLALDALAAERVAGRSVVIVRGSGGRALLGDELRARGASVQYVEVYRRRAPAAVDGELAARADIVTVTSVEGLENLLAGLAEPERGMVLRKPLVTSGARVSEVAGTAGFRGRIVTAISPADHHMAAALVELAPEVQGVSG